MEMLAQLSDEKILELIGERLARLRLEKNLTQGQLAEQAGLGVRTVQRLESGAVATQLSGFVRICRVLGLMKRFEAFIPEQGPSPMEQLKQQGQKRQRATGKKKSENKTNRWTWGDAI